MALNPDDATAYDARCLNCEGVHIVWLQSGHEPGDKVGYPHGSKPGACGRYGRHTIVAELSALDHPDVRP